MHDGWQYVAGAYVLIGATLALWFGMIIPRLRRVSAELAAVERAGTASVSEHTGGARIEGGDHA